MTLGKYKILTKNNQAIEDGIVRLLNQIGEKQYAMTWYGYGVQDDSVSLNSSLPTHFKTHYFGRKLGYISVPKIINLHSVSTSRGNNRRMAWKIL